LHPRGAHGTLRGMTTLHDFTVRTIDGQDKALRDYAGKAVLIVNVASACGLTPHYDGLQTLHERFAARGLVVLGFPCNDFGAQEPGTEAEIKHFCSTRYSVTFPMFAKLHVKGPEQAPLFAFLTSQPSAPDGPGDIAWNFAKILVGPDGKVVARFAPTTVPLAPDLLAAIERALPAAR
jgi:glutathione peroxidase